MTQIQTCISHYAENYRWRTPGSSTKHGDSRRCQHRGPDGNPTAKQGAADRAKSNLVLPNTHTEWRKDHQTNIATSNIRGNQNKHESFLTLKCNPPILCLAASYCQRERIPQQVQCKERNLCYLRGTDCTLKDGQLGHSMCCIFTDVAHRRQKWDIKSGLPEHDKHVYLHLLDCPYFWHAWLICGLSSHIHVDILQCSVRVPKYLWFDVVFHKSCSLDLTS